MSFTLLLCRPFPHYFPPSPSVPSPFSLDIPFSFPAGFLQCFDTVGLVIWPVKIVHGMTYNVLSGTLDLYTATLSLHMPSSLPPSPLAFLSPCTPLSGPSSIQLGSLGSTVSFPSGSSRSLADRQFLLHSGLIITVP